MESKKQNKYTFFILENFCLNFPTQLIQCDHLHHSFQALIQIQLLCRDCASKLTACLYNLTSTPGLVEGINMRSLHVGSEGLHK